MVGEASAVDKHPGSMPNAREVKVKLLFDRSSRKILGGQACGGLTTGEIANVIAT